MTVNEGTIDRVLRIAIGAGLLLWFIFDPSTGFWHWAKLIGILPLVTGIVGHCPAYTLLSMSTCPMRR
jgi:hypothetical protein